MYKHCINIYKYCINIYKYCMNIYKYDMTIYKYDMNIYIYKYKWNIYRCGMKIHKHDMNIYNYDMNIYNNGMNKYKNISHHHHHDTLVVRISLTISRHSSLSFIALGRSSGQHPVSSHSCWMYVRAGRPAFARPWVHPCFSSIVLYLHIFHTPILFI